jgi:hypothetical protein
MGPMFEWSQSKTAASLATNEAERRYLQGKAQS